MLNPIVAVIHNVGANRWHPVYFYEAPLPGPPSADKPVRHKSKSHHTAGFESRDSALENARDELAPMIKKNYGVDPTLSLSIDLLWDGEGVPAMVTYFGERDGEVVPMIS